MLNGTKTYTTQKCTSGKDCYYGCCLTNGTCSNYECKPGASCIASGYFNYFNMYYVNTYYGLYPTGLQCVNGVAVFNSSATNLTTAPSQCASGFSTNNICVAPVNAAIGSKCI
jgi:hypothetical protein